MDYDRNKPITEQLGVWLMRPASEDRSFTIPGHVLEMTDIWRFLAPFVQGQGFGQNHDLSTGAIEFVKPDGWRPNPPKDAAPIVIGISFSVALDALKNGMRVARTGWNGKGMFIYHVPANSYKATSAAAKAFFGADAMVPYGAYLAMKTVDGTVVPWLASQTDILAEDWSIL